MDRYFIRVTLIKEVPTKHVGVMTEHVVDSEDIYVSVPDDMFGKFRGIYNHLCLRLLTLGGRYLKKLEKRNKKKQKEVK